MLIYFSFLFSYKFLFRVMIHEPLSDPGIYFPFRYQGVLILPLSLIWIVFHIQGVAKQTNLPNSF
ncbi:hypothetical protein JHK82_012277 [Glycine max]|uniref:Uncharacterized protein n=1 Tax=Glycine max TaxID=3847 RepID=A0A0R0JS88_SOYBN|nr:hypothetical protein JHK87_012185 [Glycine soja]KAG5040152.1 hypothetical protein JHK85_012628 [Glycine max]KAG5057292.1 hypothetical protein JHK86_012288 [Glycine max]KAG5154308.1 hypothetical protein JHK82_012277 [Glycine max]KAH1133462.1 hypothetical protein GYH30_012036 [Glycine max]